MYRWLSISSGKIKLSYTINFDKSKFDLEISIEILILWIRTYWKYSIKRFNKGH
jgi:hypothetical protein